jgi:Fe-S-cluster containining protein
VQPSAEEIDLCSPCSHCGLCCTGTFVLWYFAGDRRRGVEIDRPTLSEVFEADVGPELPAIVREWNTAGGWTDAPEGAATDAGELLALLERHAALDADGRLARLAAFVRDARASAAVLFIRYD